MSGVASIVDSNGGARVFYRPGWQWMHSKNANRTPALSFLWSIEAKTPHCLLKLSWRPSDVLYTGSIDIARD
uniref:HipA_C domain-containing protein n=1 Tax=Mesocestoides corti TaxID=53468 RepID=A0A5K3FXT6_MESCO